MPCDLAESFKVILRFLLSTLHAIQVHLLFSFAVCQIDSPYYFGTVPHYDVYQPWEEFEFGEYWCTCGINGQPSDCQLLNCAKDEVKSKLITNVISVDVCYS